MSAEQLAAFVADASKALADQREREAEAKRNEAMRTIKKVLTDASADLHRAGEAVEAKDTKAIVAHLTSVIEGCREAVKALGARAPRKQGNGNGGSRESGIREDIVSVFTQHPDVDFSPTEMAHEMPAAPNGNERSSGAVLAQLERMVTLGLAVQTSDKPKKFRSATDAQG
jgi:hypothetical protein